MVDGSVDSGCHKLSEKIWFVWSKTSYSGEKASILKETTLSADRGVQRFTIFHNTTKLKRIYSSAKLSLNSSPNSSPNMVVH